MDKIDLPQHSHINVDGVTFFSNFDSGNLARAVRTGIGQYEIWIAADAAQRGHNSYRVWFNFGIRGLRKGTLLKLTIMNMSNIRILASQNYRPVWRAIPEQTQWQRILTECSYENNFATLFKLSWTMEYTYENSDLYFAFAPPYPYSEIMKTIDFFENVCPADSLFYRETLVRSLDNLNVEVITISNRENFQNQREEKIPYLFPSQMPRSFKAKKPIIFISARVHPGETPGSFILDGFLQALLSQDIRGFMLRKNYVFKIIPVLNPDGVRRGHFRVDQNAVNLNRCYESPSFVDQPTIYAAKVYFEYLHKEGGIDIYLDFHAHNSKRGCFVYGNCLPPEKQIENELFAKIIELNSPFFDFNECDFSEKSMTSKDPKDHFNKEGSGRVAFYKTAGIICSYTVECAYNVPIPLHTVSPLVNVKTGRRLSESINYILTPDSIDLYNRAFFNDIGSAVAFTILDYTNINPITRIPTSEFKNLEAIKAYLEVRQHLPSKGKAPVRRSLSRNDPKVKQLESKIIPQKLAGIAKRQIHKMKIVSPMFSDRNATSVGAIRSKKRLGLLLHRGKPNNADMQIALGNK
ncbi:AGBL5_3 [Blepharisma stoltei]|uniref:Cytosolic carboxypeptidase-like protein 5 n=1 Tax=Blepharisma stoltei TaxID=1481888 RepID=A0AAU9IW01_9CILI|nr:unnamed protein product [Blepharisma stoltei]